MEAKGVGDPDGMLGTLAESKLTSLDGQYRDAWLTSSIWLWLSHSAPRAPKSVEIFWHKLLMRSMSDPAPAPTPARPLDAEGMAPDTDAARE